MATVHGYAPSEGASLRGIRTLCGEPVHALPDMRDKVTEDALAINCGLCLTRCLPPTAGPVAWADTYRTHVTNMNGPIEPPAGGPWELVTAAVVPFGNEGMVDVIHFWRRRNG